MLIELSCLCTNTSSGSLAPKDIIPVGVALTVFVGNVWLQDYNRRKDIKEKLSSEVISTCDKMVKYTIETEYSALTLKYWNKKLTFYPLSNAANKENNKNAITEAVYYQRKMEDYGLKIDLLKSELKKSLKDLQYYWGHAQQVNQIINLMKDAGQKHPRRFESLLNETYSTEEELKKDYCQLIDKVEKEAVFEGLGFDLIRIQKIIDPLSPSMLVSNELEAELSKKIKNAEETERQEEIARIIRNSR